MLLNIVQAEMSSEEIVRAVVICFIKTEIGRRCSLQTGSKIFGNAISVIRITMIYVIADRYIIRQRSRIINPEAPILYVRISCDNVIFVSIYYPVSEGRFYFKSTTIC